MNKIVITCAKGVSPFLREEVISLGFPVLSEGVSSIETEGTLDDTMKFNLFIRTGQRVLFRIKEFKARNPEELYREISSIGWEQYISHESYLSVTSSVSTPTIKDTRFANLKVKDAIVDRLYRKLGQRPNSGPDRAGVVVHLYWKGDLGLLYLDTSGDPLSRRGYKKVPVEAPMQETLAAAVILAMGWKGSGSFINPMCGSGTLVIEALLIALGRAPGLFRSNFGFMHLRGFNGPLWNEMRKKARIQKKNALGGKILATDRDPEAIQAAKKNAMTAGVEHLIEFGIYNYSETPIPENGGIVIVNPPYGQRLGEIRELEGLYEGIGDFFKKNCKGYFGYIFTGNFDLAKKVGLRTKRRVPFYNGDIECRLLEYELYEGTRKHQ